MKAIVWLAGFAVLASAIGATAKAPVVLQPSGKWVVDFEDKMCVMSHDFGTGREVVTVAFRPWPLSNDAQLILIGWGHAPATGEIADGNVVVGNSPPNHLHYMSWRNDRTGKSMTSINVRQDQLDGLRDGEPITIQAGGRTIAFAPIGLARAQKVIDDCQNSLVKSWGIDPPNVTSTSHRREARLAPRGSRRTIIRRTPSATAPSETPRSSTRF